MITRRHALGAGGLTLLLAACDSAQAPRAITEDGSYDLLTVLRSKPEHRRFVAALQVSGLAARVGRSQGAATLFVPTNEGFNGLPAELLALLDNPPSAPTEPQRQSVAAIVNANAAYGPGLLRLADIAARRSQVTTWDRAVLTVTQTGPRTATLARAGAPAGRPPVSITRGDVLASDGVIHVTNAPILP